MTEEIKDQLPIDDCPSPSGDQETADEPTVDAAGPSSDQEETTQVALEEGADEPSLVIDEDEGPPKGMPNAGAAEGMVRALADLKTARQQAEAARVEAKEAEDRLLRLAAEFENYKRRINREREDDRKYGNERLLRELLPPIDNLERAIDASRDASTPQLCSGVEMVLRQLLDVMHKFGVEQFSSVGQPFNPELHEAMQQVETRESPPGTVVTEYMKGYMLNGRLLRPAMVVVSKAPPKDAEASRGEPGSEATPKAAEERPEEES